MKKVISMILCAILLVQSFSVYATFPKDLTKAMSETTILDKEILTSVPGIDESGTSSNAESEEKNEVSDYDTDYSTEEAKTDNDSASVSALPDEGSIPEQSSETSVSSVNPAENGDILFDFSAYEIGESLSLWALNNAVEVNAIVSESRTLVITAAMKEDTHSYDPYYILILADSIPAIEYSTVKVGLRWTGTSSGVSPEIYFKTNTNFEWMDGDFYQSAVPNNAVTSQSTVEFTFDMSEKAGWKDTITELRIDPANTKGTFELEYIRFVSNGNQIIYDANGGISAPRNLIHLENGVYELSTEQPTRNGYEFIGWSLLPDGTAADTVKTVTVADADVTVYAVWQRNVYNSKSYGFASDFDLDGDFCGWTISAASFRKKEVSDGILNLETVVNDARMHKAFEYGEKLDSQYCMLKIRYKPISNAHTAILRWQRSTDPYVDNDIVNAHENGRVQSVYLPGEENEWHELTIDLSENTAWNGDIRALWFDVANYWEINADNPGRIEYDYIRFYLKGTNHLNYDANITLAADASGNSEVIVTNMPENENNVPNGSGYLVSKVVPVASDNSIYFAGWSLSKSNLTTIDDDEIYIGGDTTLYAVWKAKAVSQADFPYKSQYPNGIQRVSDNLLKDIAQINPINTGFETVTEINDIRNNSYNGKLSVTDDAYEGRFALKVKADTVSDLFPLKELKADSNTMFARVFASDEKAINEFSSYLVETPLLGEKAETYSATDFSDATHINEITLQIKPKYMAKELSFYLRTAYQDGYSMYIKVLGDKNGDGVFTCHEDFETGQWNEITLDLHQTEQMLPNGMFSGIFVKVNENSEWLFDAVKGECNRMRRTALDLSALEKDNFVYDGNELHFEEIDSDDLEEFNTKTVVTSAVYDVDGKITGIKPSIAQYPDNYLGYQISINQNILPDLFSGSEVFQIDADLKNNTDGAEYYVGDDGSIQITAETPEPGLYRLSVSAHKLINNSYLYVKLNNNSSMSMPIKSSQYSIHNVVLPITETTNTIVLSSKEMYVNGVTLTKIDPAETNKRMLFAGIPSTESIPCTGTEVNYQDLPFIPNGTYSGTSETIQCNLRKTEYMVITVINPSFERAATMEVGTDTYNLHYGKWDYIIANSGSTVSKITFSDGNEPILVTEARKYNRIPGNSVSAVDTGISEDFLYSQNCEIVYYIDNNYIYSYHFGNDETRQITGSPENETLTLKAISPNGKFLMYKSTDNCDYIYSYDANATVIGENVYDICRIDNYGNCYGVSDEDTSVCLKSDGTAAFSLNADNAYTTRKNDGEGWYTFSSGTLPVEKDFQKEILFDESGFKVYITVVDRILENSEYIYSSNPGINIFDPLTGELTWLNITDGTLLSVTEEGNLVMNINGKILLVNPTTKERALLYSEMVSELAYYNESVNRLLYTNDEDHVMYYSTKARTTSVKMLLSFDEGTHWQSYQNGRWISVYNEGMEPTENIFEEYGMTAEQLSALSEKDFQSLYENGKQIYTLGIALCVTSESKYNTPKVRNIAVQTTEPDPKRYLYTAKGQTYSKEDFSRINAIFANTNVYGSDECYFFICLGDDWIYTYKGDELLRMKLTAQELFGNVSGNWMDIRQYGMSNSELRAIPESVLSSLLLNERYANDSFTIAYCIKTERDETNGITAAFHLVYDPKIADVSGKTIKILLTDQSVLTFSAEDVDENEITRFLLWLETKQANSNGSPFFKLSVKDRIYYINYYMIKSVEICVE